MRTRSPFDRLRGWAPVDWPLYPKTRNQSRRPIRARPVRNKVEFLTRCSSVGQSPPLSGYVPECSRGTALVGGWGSGWRALSHTCAFGQALCSWSGPMLWRKQRGPLARPALAVDVWVHHVIVFLAHVSAPATGGRLRLCACTTAALPPGP